MADIVSQEVDIEWREKLGDGTYLLKYPKTKLSNVLGAEAKLDAIKADTEQILAKLTIGDDFSGSPGRTFLLAGDMDSGYFGLVSAGELISGTALASSIGLSNGAAFNSDAGWFKFAFRKKILFVAKKPMRHTISWDHIDAVGAVFGAATVTIGGLTYKVRLLTGGNNDPASEAGGEWDELIYGIHGSQPPDWDNYTDAGIGVGGTLDGRYNWCQETSSSNSAYRVNRGGSGVAYFGTNSVASASARYGWRPVLELV